MLLTSTVYLKISSTGFRTKGFFSFETRGRYWYMYVLHVSHVQVRINNNYEHENLGLVRAVFKLELLALLLQTFLENLQKTKIHQQKLRRNTKRTQ